MIERALPGFAVARQREEFVWEIALRLLYDVFHNTCKLEEHLVGGKPCSLYAPARWRG